jgi:hypothetical protein
MNMISITVINVDNTVKTNVLGFRDYNFTMIFIYRPMINFWVRNIYKKMLTFLELPAVMLQSLC